MTMAGVKGLILLSFTASIGITFLFLSCGLPQFNNWWPFFVVAFYLVSPIPSLIARRISDNSASNPCKELANFATAVIVISAFGLPIVLARSPVAAPVIQWGACWLVMFANLITFSTIFGFFVMADGDSIDYSMW